MPTTELPFSDEELREMADDLIEWHGRFDAILMAGEQGTYPCRRCGADANWLRVGPDWTMRCDTCGWSAAGAVSAKLIEN